MHPPGLGRNFHGDFLDSEESAKKENGERCVYVWTDADEILAEQSHYFTGEQTAVVIRTNICMCKHRGIVHGFVGSIVVSSDYCCAPPLLCQYFLSLCMCLSCFGGIRRGSPSRGCVSLRVMIRPISGIYSSVSIFSACRLSTIVQRSSHEPWFDGPSVAAAFPNILIFFPRVFLKTCPMVRLLSPLELLHLVRLIILPTSRVHTRRTPARVLTFDVRVFVTLISRAGTRCSYVRKDATIIWRRPMSLAASRRPLALSY